MSAKRHNLCIFTDGTLMSSAETAVYHIAADHIKSDDVLYVYGMQQIEKSDAIDVRQLKLERGVCNTARLSDISNKPKDIKIFIDNVYRANVTLEAKDVNAGMAVTIVLPSLLPNCIEFVENVVRAVDESVYTIDVDIIVLSEIICKETLKMSLSEDNLTMGEVLPELVKIKQRGSSLKHIIPLDDRNSDGVSIKFDKKLLGDIFGEYLLLAINHYYDLYPVVFDANPGQPIKALGMSVMLFDVDYFVKYLRRKAVLEVMNAENIGVSGIDINEANKYSKKWIIARKKDFNSFWSKNVQPLIDSNQTQENIIPQANAALKKLCDSANAEIDEIISDENLSLPMKQAILAQILGDDDTLLKGVLFDKTQDSLEEIEKEPVDFFVEEDNHMRPTRDQIENAKKDNLTPPPNFSIISKPLNSTGLLYSPLDEIKKLRYNIKTQMDYIRNTEEEINNLDEQLRSEHQSEKCLTEKGFTFGGVKYQLQQFNDSPVEETYVPQEVTTGMSIDMRSCFTPVKAQGELGSCTAFAMTAIMEYLALKTGSAETDLSESFLYYNTRARNNMESADAGTSIYDCIHALSERGICTETLCPYSDTEYREEPTTEAYEDGKNRRILKALNVERTVDAIRSALNEGFPVAISLNLTEGFSQCDNGFVEMPDSVENLDGSHAMVIVGFDDETKFFIVRNSWGEEFGDNGYCYIPYRYIGDTRLLNAAYLVKETTFAEDSVQTRKPTRVTFNTDDAKIKKMIARNLLEEAKDDMKKMSSLYKLKINDYAYLVGRLKNGAVRDSILENSRRSLAVKIGKTEESLRDVQINRQKALDEHSKINKWVFVITIAISFVVIIAVLGWLFKEWSMTPMIVSGFILVLSIVWLSHYKSTKNRIRREFDDRLDDMSIDLHRIKNSADLISMRNAIYGQMLQVSSDIQKYARNSYLKLKSFNSNLDIWRVELERKISDMNPIQRRPFVPMLENRRLDEFFEKYSKNLMHGVNLYSLLPEYKLSDEGLVNLKQRLNQKFDDHLKTLLSGFSIVKYLFEPTKYPFLAPNIPEALVAKMEKWALPFCCYRNLGLSTSPSNMFLVDAADHEGERFRNLIRSYCAVSPDSINTDNPNKLTLIRCLQLEDGSVL